MLTTLSLFSFGFVYASARFHFDNKKSFLTHAQFRADSRSRAKCGVWLYVRVRFFFFCGSESRERAKFAPTLCSLKQNNGVSAHEHPTGTANVLFLSWPFFPRSCSTNDTFQWIQQSPHFPARYASTIYHFFFSFFFRHSSNLWMPWIPGLYSTYKLFHCNIHGILLATL